MSEFDPTPELQDDTPIDKRPAFNKDPERSQLCWLENSR
jgi:hypothetical protein